MATIRIQKYLSAIYNEVLRETFKTEIAVLCGPSMKIGISFNANGPCSYTRVYGKLKDHLLISLGGKSIVEMEGLPEKISSKGTAKSLYPGTIKMFKSHFKHEMGHDKFTDMICDAIVNYKEPIYIPFIHNMFNILEDQVIEFCMEMLYKKEYPYEINPRVYFDHMIKVAYMPQGETYEDDGTQIGFMNYVLLYFRIGPENIKKECAIFEKYKKDLIPLFRNVIGEIDGTQRIYKTIELCEWIIKNITEFDWKMPDLPPEEKVSGRGIGTKTSGPSKGFKGADKRMPSGGGGTPGADEDAPDKDDGPGSEEKESEEEKSEEEKESEESRVNSEMDQEAMDDIFNDILHDGQDHEWVIAKDDFEIANPGIVDEIDKIIDENSDQINDISTFLTTFKGRIKPVFQEGYYSGKLSMRSVMREEMKDGISTKFFKKKITRGKDNDVCLCEVGDNSGSMSGRKSILTTKGMLAVAQAADWCGIPFEAHCFTKTCDSFDGTSVTITQKSLDDDFEKAKPYFAINSTSMIRALTPLKPVPVFRGNSEEVNLFYIGEKFKRVPHKTKLMFVFCDGMTTGSREELRELVNKLESQDGIIVIGIGILDDGVAGVYNHYKVFKTEKELETELAPYLIETLGKYAV